MSKREPKLLFEDILECAEKILRYTDDVTFEQFMQDERTMDAVIRNYEVIG